MRPTSLAVSFFILANNSIAGISSDISPKLDLSIEGMRSQEFSVGVFYFLLLGIAVFTGIVFAFLFSKNRPTRMRMGEKLMFGAIFLGIIVAVIFGATQMVNGVLF
jgi:hypothetical protein